jgi:FAD:protein FMN transferase
LIRANFGDDPDMEETVGSEIAIEAIGASEFAFRFRAMASPCELHLADLARADAREIAQRCIDEVVRVESKYSRYREDSVVSRINAAAGSSHRVKVDPETLSLLDFAATLHRESEGRFDITSGILRRAWNFHDARIPSEAALRELLPLIDATAIELCTGDVRLTKPGMEIDFGGFGKEYAADRAAAIAESLGARHGFVNLGGDLRAIGPRADGSPWSIGIQHPRDPQATIAHIALSHGALATSGDYERFFERDGQRYCHILDPRTGMSAQYWQSISVLGAVCVAAGALATIAMLRGDDAIEFLNAQATAYLAIRHDGARFSRSNGGATRS